MDEENRPAAADESDEAVEGEVRNVERYPSERREAGGPGSYSPATAGSKSDNTAEGGTDPSLLILIGLAALAGIGLIVVVFFFAGDPYGVQAFLSDLPALAA